MFLALVSHLLGAVFAFALPSYATHKAIVRTDHDALRTLAMYWAVLALATALEHSLGLVLSWLPFYWELRTLFLLYIALPQTQGSTYIYTSLLGPWLAKNEADIDGAMVSAQANAIAMCRARIAALVDLVASALNSSVLPRAETDPHKPAQPLASPVDQLARVLAAYAPSAFAPKDSSDAHVSATASQQSHQSYSAN